LAKLIGGGLEQFLAMDIHEFIAWHEEARELEHERKS